MQRDEDERGAEPAPRADADGEFATEADENSSNEDGSGSETTDAGRKVPGVDVLVNPLTRNGLSFHEVGVDESGTLGFDLFVAPGFDGKLFELYRQSPRQRQHLVVTAGRLEGDLLEWDGDPTEEPATTPVSLEEGEELTVPEGHVLSARNGSEEEPVELEVTFTPAKDTEAFLRHGYALGLRVHREQRAEG